MSTYAGGYGNTSVYRVYGPITPVRAYLQPQRLAFVPASEAGFGNSPFGTAPFAGGPGAIGRITLGGAIASAPESRTGDITLGGSAAVAAPKVDTLTDDFATQDTAKWSFGAAAAVSGGVLSCTLNGSYTGYARSLVPYDLTGSQIVAEVPVHPTGPAYTNTYLQLTNTNGVTGATNGVAFSVEQTSFTVATYVGGAYSVVATTTYSATNHRWWRIRQVGANVLFDISADGSTWTQFHSLAPSFSTAALYVELGAGGTPPSSPTAAQFDNVNTSTTTAATATGAITLGGTVTAPTAAATVTGAITLGGAATADTPGSGVTSTHLTTDSSTTNTTSYTTASITPTANRLVLLALTVTSAASPTPTPTITGNGLTWEQVTQTVAGSRTLHLFRAMGAAPTAGAVTIAGGSFTSALWQIVELAGVDTGGANGSAAAINATNTKPASATSVSVPISPTPTAGDGYYAVIATAVQETPAPGTGWTDLGGTNQSAPTSGMDGMFAGSSIPANITATWTTAANSFVVGTEILAATGGATAATASGAITLGGTATATASPTTTGSITLGGTLGAPTVAAAAAGALTLAGAPSAAARPTAAGTVTLSGTATPPAGPATAAGSIALSGAPAPTGLATATGTVTLGGAPTAAASPSAAGILTLSGTVSPPTVSATTAGTITLSGAPTAGATASSAGTITLSGAPTARAGATTTGTITLAGTATGVVPGVNTAAGTVTLSGTVSARAAASATTGTVTLAGAPTASVTAATTGTVTLSGTAVAAARPTVGGGIVLAGTATAVGTNPATATGGVTLTGTGTARPVVTVGGIIVLGGTPTARVPATVAGALTLSAIANAYAVGSLRHLTVTIGAGRMRRLTVAHAPVRHLRIAGRSRALTINRRE